MLVMSEVMLLCAFGNFMLGLTSKCFYFCFYVSVEIIELHWHYNCVCQCV